MNFPFRGRPVLFLLLNQELRKTMSNLGGIAYDPQQPTRNMGKVPLFLPEEALLGAYSILRYSNTHGMGGHKMKNDVRWMSVVLLLAVAPVAFAGGSVHVRGHVRKDGTYVQPHYRSAPDSSFYNNWSTKGNINPYTGEDGKVVTPPMNRGYGGYSLPSVPSVLPQPSSSSSSAPTTSMLPESPSITVSPRTDESVSDYLARSDREARQRQAERLRSMGYEVDWQKMSYLDMSDMESRIRQAKRLDELGYPVDWRTRSYLNMSDMESRIRQAKRLQEMGCDVDWQKTSYLAMADMESRIRQATRLKKLGIDVDWHTHTYLDMSSMEYRARQNQKTK